MAPWWVSLAGVALTGVLAWAAQAWAKRGDKQISAGELAISMAKEALERVEAVERENAWRTAVDALKDRYIVRLLTHIHHGFPPPPPEEPVYPPRPA
jgi:hypothetical protein